MVLSWWFVAIAKLSAAFVDWMQADILLCAALVIDMNANS